MAKTTRRKRRAPAKRTPAQIAASKKNLEKARAARASAAAKKAPAKKAAAKTASATKTAAKKATGARKTNTLQTVSAGTLGRIANQNIHTKSGRVNRKAADSANAAYAEVRRRLDPKKGTWTPKGIDEIAYLKAKESLASKPKRRKTTRRKKS